MSWEYDAASFKAGFALGRLLWRPPVLSGGLEIDHIRVVVPPDKLDYQYNEPIDYEGMIVAAYDAQDRYIRQLPIGWLTLPTVAIYDPWGTSSAWPYPEHPTDGKVLVTSVGSCTDTFNQALTKWASVYDPNNVLTAIRDYLGNFDGVTPCTVSIWAGSGSFSGWSPLNVNVETRVALGSKVILGSTYNPCNQVRTNGTNSGGGSSWTLRDYRIYTNTPVNDHPLWEGTPYLYDNAWHYSSLHTAFQMPVKVIYTRADGVAVSDFFDALVVDSPYVPPSEE